MSALIKYEPLLEIETYDWEKYYELQSKKKKLDLMINELKFIIIWENTIAVSSIKSIKPAKQEINLIEQKICDLNEETKIKIRTEVKKYKIDFPHKEITEWIIDNIISYYLTK